MCRDLSVPEGLGIQVSRDISVPEGPRIQVFVCGTSWITLGYVGKPTGKVLLILAFIGFLSWIRTWVKSSGFWVDRSHSISHHSELGHVEDSSEVISKHDERRIFRLPVRKNINDSLLSLKFHFHDDLFEASHPALEVVHPRKTPGLDVLC